MTDANLYRWLCEKSLVWSQLNPQAAIIKQSVADLMEQTGSNRGFGFLQQDGALILIYANCPEGSSQQDTRVHDLAKTVLQRNEPTFVFGAWHHGAKRSWELFNVKQLICIPLRKNQQNFGVIYLDSAMLHPNLDESKVPWLSLVAEHIALSIEQSGHLLHAANDLLTGLPHGNSFLHQLHLATQAATTDKPAGLLILDIDTFKRVNQVAGTQQGNLALIDIAHTLRDTLATDGLVARFGSDKFGILLPPESQPPIALRLRDVAERARATIATRIYHGISLTACIGGLSITGSKLTPSAWLAKADDLLLQARQQAPGSVAVATE